LRKIICSCSHAPDAPSSYTKLTVLTAVFASVECPKLKKNCRRLPSVRPARKNASSEPVPFLERLPRTRTTVRYRPTIA
jgi:hypothetical protein